MTSHVNNTSLAEYRKAIVGVIGFLVTVVSVALEGHLIPEVAVPYVVAALGVATSYGVYRVPNQPQAPV